MMSIKNILLCIISLPVHTHSDAQNIGKKTIINPYNYTIKKEVNSKNGIVACAHPLAALAGIDILKQGGNAIDAAIATQLALAVVYPGAGNLGGGGFLVATLGQQHIALDFRETAPAKSSKDMYLNNSGKANLELSQEGALASGVPGTVAGLFEAMKYAKLPFETLIQPAIELADKGFVITEMEANSLNSNQAAFLKNNKVVPAFVKSGQGWWQAGDTLVQKDLAKTLMRIQDNGKDGFYKGETAELIVSGMKSNDGIITLSDLRKYTVEERVPVEFSYKGYQIITMPLPSSGGIMLQQMLKMLESRPLAQYGFMSPKGIQLITEVERRAYADRAEYLGDPDFIKVPVKTLVSEEYLHKRLADYDSIYAGKSINIKAGIIAESEETTHLSIIDKDGNCVAVTTTLNGQYGSKCVVAGAGFLMNNEMDDFSVQPGVPNQYGAIGGQANAIAPRKRMLSSMSPTIVLKDGKPFIVVGTPGGTTIITSVLQSILDVIDFGLNAHDAVNMPKFHHQWLPDQIDIEKNFPSDILAQLKAMGYTLNIRKPWSRTELIKLVNNGLYEASADRRGDDDAEGY